MTLLFLVCTHRASGQPWVEEGCCPTDFALEFDGIDDYVEVVDTTSLNAIGTGDFTFEAWFKGLDSDQGSHPQIFSNRPYFGQGFVFGFHDAVGGSSHKIPLVQLGSKNWTDPSSPQYLDGEWHYFAATREGDTLTYYIDGGEISKFKDGSILTASIAANRPLWIGRDVATAFFDGSIDQPCIWKVSRTPTEIVADMSGNFSVFDSDLVACWTMNEGEGQSIGDLTPIAEDGVLGTGAGIDSADPTWIPGYYVGPRRKHNCRRCCTCPRGRFAPKRRSCVIGRCEGLEGAPNGDLGGGYFIWNETLFQDISGAVCRELAEGESCEPNCVWTDWFNNDAPGGDGDWETLKHLLPLGEACEKPCDIECKTLDDKDWTTTGEKYTCDPAVGGYCVNAKQPDKECLNYKVRFKCPE